MMPEAGYWMLDTGCSIFVTLNQRTENRVQMTDDGLNIADAGNQMVWIAHPRNSLDSRCPLSYSMRYALCSKPFFARNPEPSTLSLEP